MHQYAILYHPGHNRVYYEESKRFCLYELEAVAQRAGLNAQQAQLSRIGGVDYITFACPEPLGEEAVRDLFHLSFLYALFERMDDGLLRPMAAPDFHTLDPGISSMLKYTGKTNERFTRTMVNLAVSAAAFPRQERIRLLDPVAGKGTTLFEAASCGYDAYGIEIGDNVVVEVYHFFKQYLERARMKHTFHKERVSGPNKSFTATRYHFQYAGDKASFKGDDAQTLEIVAGDSAHADTYFRKESFHVVVGDLPYGVQHGNVTGQKQNALTRNPKELVKHCLPAWQAVLKPGGTLVLAWNCQVLPREALAAIIREAGMTVLEGEAYSHFSHRVDQSIQRDLIVAQKPFKAQADPMKDCVQC